MMKKTFQRSRRCSSFYNSREYHPLHENVFEKPFEELGTIKVKTSCFKVESSESLYDLFFRKVTSVEIVERMFRRCIILFQRENNLQRRAFGKN